MISGRRVVIPTEHDLVEHEQIQRDGDDAGEQPGPAPRVVELRHEGQLQTGVDQRNADTGRDELALTPQDDQQLVPARSEVVVPVAPGEREVQPEADLTTQHNACHHRKRYRITDQRNQYDNQDLKRGTDQAGRCPLDLAIKRDVAQVLQLTFYEAPDNVTSPLSRARRWKELHTNTAQEAYP